MKVLVYGWYHQTNIGDDLFISAFEKLFPNYRFVFCSNISIEDLNDVNAIFFGGGSFLLEEPYISPEALEKIKKIPIFYLGVGVEIDIHPVHLDLIARAKMIVTRSPDQIDRLKEINPNVMWIPDLVYCLQESVENFPKIGRSILVLPNISVIPNHMDPLWKHTAWLHFKTEFAQFLDYLVESEYSIKFLSMCRGDKDNDNWAASEIINHMVHRDSYLLQQPSGMTQTTALISQYDLVITQRFHGIVLAEMTKTPYIAIHHHDKLKYAKPGNGSFISYWNISKHSLIELFDQTIKMNFDTSLPIEENIFKAFSQKIIELVENGSLCRS